jgi:sialate O-acetylesterase
VDGDWGTMSATCYFTGRGLYKALGGEVPIGLVASDWGGTRVEAWSSPDALAKCPSAEEEDAAVDSSDAAILFNDPDPNNSSVLFNGMIAPILPMRFKLATWYQGESNAADPNGYMCKFPAMISDWRVKFNLTLPFFFVQVAAYPDGGANWPQLQIAQTAALELDNMGMATAMDLGDPTAPEGSIHPRDKQTVGARLVLSILDVVYGQSVVSTGPIPQAFSMSASDSLTVTMTLMASTTTGSVEFQGTENCNTSGGCCAENPFELGTNKGNWYRAETASIAPPNVIAVSISQLADGGEIVAIRYAYEAYAQCALYNTAGLPMTPFVETKIPTVETGKPKHKIHLTEQ